MDSYNFLQLPCQLWKPFFYIFPLLEAVGYVKVTAGDGVISWHKHRFDF